MPRVRFAKTLNTLSRARQIHISNSRRAKSQSSAAPVFYKARGAPGISVPSLTRGNAPSPKVRGAERRKARVTSIRLAAHAQCDGRSPRGAPLRRFSLDPETAFCEQTGAAIRNALDSAGFHPRSSAPTSRVAPTDPRNWAGQCLPRAPGTGVRDPSAGAESAPPLDASRWHPHVNEPGTECTIGGARSTVRHRNL